MKITCEKAKSMNHIGGWILDPWPYAWLGVLLECSGGDWGLGLF